MSRYIKASVKKAVRKRDKNKCVYCGYRHFHFFKWNLNKPLEWGHVIPYSKRGNNCAENIQQECFDCNRRKSATENKLGWFARWTRKEAKGCRGRCKH